MNAIQKRKGITILELLIALAITAMLLTAVAAGIHASFLNLTENDCIRELTQSARWHLSRIAAEIRTADAVDTTGGILAIVPPENTDGITKIEYELADGAFTRYVTIAGDRQPTVLMKASDKTKVDIFQLSQRNKTVDDQLVTECVTILLRLSNGDNRTFRATISAAPRRNQAFQL